MGSAFDGWGILLYTSTVHTPNVHVTGLCQLECMQTGAMSGQSRCHPSGQSCCT
jgi:hypothetical protein